TACSRPVTGSQRNLRVFQPTRQSGCLYKRTRKTVEPLHDIASCTSPGTAFAARRSTPQAAMAKRESRGQRGNDLLACAPLVELGMAARKLGARKVKRRSAETGRGQPCNLPN